ncbi:chitinase 3 [Gaeumannomyces tritici R3-111a-1]|uniref:Chitinase 3 n=1 Tax=Gaeumannomyces tritici (strain R3-111a-1) TaxID=644352 RepID=J3NQ05_GAET3|nr:chitinase 3 [Gaeumannomyces tritici R3-111a-1]EJT78261.1 chitinase 3 [Gaeumannomyces tritici R3-111a-1]
MKPTLIPWLAALLLLLAAPSLSRPLDDAADTLPVRAPSISLPRLAIYYQTTHDATTGRPISMLPLVTEQHIALTHLIVCTLHVRADRELYLNDFPPSHPRFATVWAEAAVLRDSGVRVVAMVGGAAEGSFAADTLDAPEGSPLFERAYGQLRDALRRFGLQGLDVDVEQPMSQRGAARLVGRLRADFGPEFTITMAPVASALTTREWPNLSGFSYRELEATSGRDVEFYNAQFYNGFGDMIDTGAFDSVVAAGYDPRRIVAGQVTTPDNGAQWTPFDQLARTMGELRRKYGEVGGIMGWEYFNGKPGGQAKPWEWAQQITAILRPGKQVQLRVTRDDAARLEAAWATSVAGKVSGNASLAGGDDVKPDVDYWAMVSE